jgi:hypothetical protein
MPVLGVLTIAEPRSRGGKVQVPSREVKCQKCVWRGSRSYGSDGILCEPCPECGRRVEYGVSQPGDQSVTADSGEVRQPSKPRRTMAPEHKAKLAAARSARLSAFRTAEGLTGGQEEQPNG